MRGDETMSDIAKFDKNFESAAPAPGGVFHSVDEAPFALYGLSKDAAGYYRLPPALAADLNENLAFLTRQTAGGLVRFRTNATRLAVDARQPKGNFVMAHMTLLGSFGFDAYSGEHFIASFPTDKGNGEAYCVEKPLFTDSCERDADGFFEVTLYLPLYGAFEDICISVPDGYEIRSSRAMFRNSKPVVFYGSSITQGGCAATPGMAYTNIISRGMNLRCLNLGFSGNAKGEPEMAAYIASLDMAALVLDYDHNAPDAEHLWHTHAPFFEIIRAAKPNLPVVMASAIPCFIPGREQAARREAIRATYERAVACGDKNVYFLDGTKFFDEVSFDLCTVDGVHPNSMGMYRMARGFMSVLQTLNL